MIAVLRRCCLLVALFLTLGVSTPPPEPLIEVEARRDTQTRRVTVRAGELCNLFHLTLTVRVLEDDSLQLEPGDIRIPDGGQCVVQGLQLRARRILDESAPERLVQARAKTLRTLREARGHFQGGDWRDDLDAWRGEKHVLLAEFGDLLKNTSVTRVLELLGEPDHRARPGSSLWNLAHPKQGTELLIYEWRGLHDFLYFSCQGPHVLDSGWWMAGE